MAKNALDTVGDGALLKFGAAGTLGLGAVACGTLTAAGVLTGSFGDTLLANGTFSASLTLYDLTPNEVDVAKVDNTKLAAVAKTSQAGTPDFGEVSAVIPYDIQTAGSINAMIAGKTMQIWQVTTDDYATTDSGQAFLGWVKKWTPMSGELKKDEVAKAKLMIQITGVPLVVAGT